MRVFWRTFWCKKFVFLLASNQGSFPCYALPIAISNLGPFSWFVFTVINNQSVPSHAKYAFSPNCMFELNFQLLILLIQHTLEILSKNYSDHWALIWCFFTAVCTGRFFNLKNGGSKSWKFDSFQLLPQNVDIDVDVDVDILTKIKIFLNH